MTLPVLQEDKKVIEAMERNERVLSNLAVAFTTCKAIVHHHKDTTTEWPDGLAYNIMKSPLRKYQPQDVMTTKML
jgi:hypothetical protein